MFARRGISTLFNFGGKIVTKLTYAKSTLVYLTIILIMKSLDLIRLARCTSRGMILFRRLEYLDIRGSIYDRQ